MPHITTWDDVQAELDGLEVYAPLDEAKERLQSLTGSRQYTPEVVKYFIELIREMNQDFEEMIQKAKNDIGKKQALRKIVQEAEAKFLQEKWAVENVTNAQNIFNFTLEIVKKEVEEPKPAIKIPVVLPVMTREEAKDLDSSKITVDMPKNYLDDLKKFKALLKPDWIENYGSSTEKWRPFDSINKNIEELMMEMLIKVQQNKGYQKPLTPYFINVQDLNRDRTVLNYLRLNGCFVINDVISMWHPEIQRQYRATLLEAFPSTIVFRIAPLNQNNQVLNSAQPLVAFLEHFQDLEFFKRVNADSDLRCKDMWMSTEFKQFVIHFTPDLIPPYEKVNSPLTGRIIGESAR